MCQAAWLSVWKVTGVPEPDYEKGLYSWLPSLKTVRCCKEECGNRSDQQQKPVSKSGGLKTKTGKWNVANWYQLFTEATWHFLFDRV